MHYNTQDTPMQKKPNTIVSYTIKPLHYSTNNTTTCVIKKTENKIQYSTVKNTQQKHYTTAQYNTIPLIY